jgi:hypothetical protein
MSKLSARVAIVTTAAPGALRRQTVPSGKKRPLALAIAVAAAVTLAGCSTSSGTHPSSTGTTTTASASNSSSSVSPATESSKSSQPTGTTGSSPTKARPAAENLVVTSDVRRQLLQVGAALNGLPTSAYTGLVSGDTYYAYDAATATYWAGAGLSPSPSSLRAQVSAQDDGSYLLFRRPSGTTWTAEDVGLAGIGGSKCPTSVPASVLVVWHWTARSCRPEALTSTVRPSAVPTLGRLAGDFAQAGKGFGQVQPSEIFNGGDPTGLVTHVVWKSWGGPDAVGTGINDYVGPNQNVSAGTEEPATVVAFNLGTCNGKLMYQAIEWYFPQHGQVFNANQYENICTGTYVPSS